MKMPPKKIVTLKAKLAIPQLTDTIFRARLSPIFAEMEKKRVITVVAGAGYGKSTLAAQACRHLKLNTVWYRLDPSDRDLITFLHYLITGIKAHYPEFGEETRRRMEAAQGIKGEHYPILTVFLNEIEQEVTKELLVVLDDFHLVQPNEEISTALNYLVQNFAAKIHLVVISRSTPSINLSRLIAAGEALEISEKDLIFRPEEIENLYKSIFGIALTQRNLDSLRRKTEGWVTGLVLFNYALKGSDNHDIEAQLNQLQGTGKLFSSYLEENIYHSLTRETTLFLTRTSILARLDINFCNEFMGIKNSGDILKQLESAHLLTFPFDENRTAYFYHHLFKSFLNAKLRQVADREQIAELHGAAARIYAKQADPVEAIDHYLKAQMHPKACRLLSQIGRALIRDGRFNLFRSYYRRIPKAIREDDPWCVYMFARALQREGIVPEAIRFFVKAKKLFSAQANAKGVWLCLHRTALAYYVMGEFSQAEALFSQLIESKENPQRLHVDALGHLIFISAHMGRVDSADHYFEIAMAGLTGIKEDDLHAWIYLNYGFRLLMAGDFTRAEEFCEQADFIARRRKVYFLVTMGYSLRSLIYLHLGEFSQGFEVALKGIQTGEQKGFIEMAQIWNWNNACCCATALGNYEQAIECGQRCLELCRDLHSIRSEAWAFHALQDAYLKSGDAAGAATAARAALQTIASLELAFDRGIMETGMASLLLEQNKPEKALPLLESARSALKGFDLYHYYTRLLFVRYYLKKNQKDKALKTLRQALKVGRKYAHDRWLVGEREWLFPLLVELYEHQELQGYLIKLMLKFGSEALLKLRKIQSDTQSPGKHPAGMILRELKKFPPPDLQITCFGKFSVKRGNLEIRPEQWPGEIPRQLFKYLCFNKNRGYLARDELLEFLWPGEAPDITGNRLRVALTKLRHTLEPELSRGMSSAYLLRKGDSYRLQLGNPGYLDLEAFDQAMAAAKKQADEENALAHYLRADFLYRGDLFAEERYGPWFVEVRERYKEKYLDLLEHIIAAYRDVRNWTKSIEYAKKYLAVDPYAEEIYQALMVFYKAIGSKSMILKTYQQCKHRIENELDCLLTDETTDLLKQLVSY